MNILLKILPTCLRLSAVVLLISVSRPAGGATSADVNPLLDGVKTIAAPGVPGTVAAFGPQAFVVVEAAIGKETQAPVVAAAKFGEGRVVIFGHDGYLAADNLKAGDTARFISNVMRWAAGPKSGKEVRVLLAGSNSLATPLTAAGFSCAAAPKGAWAQALNQADVLVLDPRRPSGEEAAAVLAFVKRGGGLVMGETGWGWMMGNKDKKLGDDHAGNKLLEPVGLAWTGGSVKVDASRLITPSHNPDSLLQCNAALDLLLRADANPPAPELLRGKTDAAKAAKHQLAQAGETLILLATSASETNPLVVKLRQLDKQPHAAKLPTDKQPLKSEDGLARLLLAMHLQRWDAVAAEQVRASPAADAFPGKVAADAPRVSKSIEVDTHVPRWHSTGLYAAPGEVVTIDVPAGAVKKGLRFQIGCHTDDLSGLDTWKRIPKIVTSTPIDAATTKLASPFGGPIYVVVPDQDNSAHIQAKSASTCDIGVVPVRISHAVEMPLFVLGKTPVEEWKRSIRQRPAPWCELATDKIILTFKSDPIRTLDDPTPVLRHWDAIQDANADLAARSKVRPCPMRIVSDVQISAGYMHSGYPIMTWLDVTNSFADVAKLKTGSGGWGFYHELGHNHQLPDWTFDGTGEVTVNLFSMHSLEVVCGLSPKESTSRALIEPAARIQKYLAKPDFEAWKNDPFLALAMYAQLRLAFGWEAYEKVFAEYRDLPKDQRPKTEEQKHDQWMVRFSKAVGKNLGPFFTAWGIPTSDTARDSIKNLPAWMPERVPGT